MPDPRTEVTIPKDMYDILMERYTMNDVKRVKYSIERDEAHLHVQALEDVHQILTLGVQDSARKLAAAQKDLGDVVQALAVIGIQIVHLPGSEVVIIKS
jgi:hypothetical protein